MQPVGQFDHRGLPVAEREVAGLANRSHDDDDERHGRSCPQGKPAQGLVQHSSFHHARKRQLQHSFESPMLSFTEPRSDRSV